MRVCRFLIFIFSLFIVAFDVSAQSLKILGKVNGFTASADQEIKLNFTLKSDSKSMDEAVILGKTETQQIKETGPISMRLMQSV